MLAVVINLLQFASVERSLPPSWQALSQAADADLAAVATERGATNELQQFSLPLALREHTPGRVLVVSDDLLLQGPLAPELLTGLGQVTCIDQRPLDQDVLTAAVPRDHPVTARGQVTAAAHPFVLLLDEPTGPTILLLDARGRRGELVLLDTSLLPAALRPEATGC